LAALVGVLDLDEGLLGVVGRELRELLLAPFPFGVASLDLFELLDEALDLLLPLLLQVLSFLDGAFVGRLLVCWLPERLRPCSEAESDRFAVRFVFFGNTPDIK
jgi:hypothetical protein